MAYQPSNPALGALYRTYDLQDRAQHLAGHAMRLDLDFNGTRRDHALESHKIAEQAVAVADSATDLEGASQLAPKAVRGARRRADNALAAAKRACEITSELY